MKIKYKVWKCLGCEKEVKILENTGSIWAPHWINIHSEGASSSSDSPSYNSSVCSTACLSKAGQVIQELIDNRRGYLIPCKKEIVATICDRCGTVVTEDLLNPMIGPGPLRNRSCAILRGKSLDFCSTKCEDGHFSKPEESVFFGLEFPSLLAKQQRLMKAIDSPNFFESIKVKEESISLFGKKLFTKPQSES